MLGNDADDYKLDYSCVWEGGLASTAGRWARSEGGYIEGFVNLQNSKSSFSSQLIIFSSSHLLFRADILGINILTYSRFNQFSSYNFLFNPSTSSLSLNPPSDHLTTHPQSSCLPSQHPNPPAWLSSAAAATTHQSTQGEVDTTHPSTPEGEDTMHP